MSFVIFGTDKPGVAAVREKVRTLHRIYLRKPGCHRVKVLLGGPTLTSEQAIMNGTLLVVEAESLCCGSGKQLMQKGYKRVRSLAGGIEAWISAGHALEL